MFVFEQFRAIILNKKSYLNDLETNTFIKILAPKIVNATKPFFKKKILFKGFLTHDLDMYLCFTVSFLR